MAAAAMADYSVVLLNLLSFLNLLQQNVCWLHHYRILYVLPARLPVNIFQFLLFNDGLYLDKGLLARNANCRIFSPSSISVLRQIFVTLSSRKQGLIQTH